MDHPTTPPHTGSSADGGSDAGASGRSVSRRRVLTASGAAAAAGLVGVGRPAAALATPESGRTGPVSGPPQRVWPLWPKSFVSTRGTSFTVDRKPWRFGGTNNYYLHYKSHYMIDSALNDAAAMGLRVVRCWSFVDGDGAGAGGLTMHPEPFVYNEDAFELFDYAVFKAGQLGLRLVVGLENNWGDFGGIPQYATWFGATHDDFFSRPDMRAAYKSWVRFVLGRTNRYTGVRHDREPVIMTWELANEPRCQSDKTGDTLVRWADEMSRFMKRLAPRQLVTVGDEGFYGRANDPDYPYSNFEGVAWPRLTALPAVDYGTVHLYPQGWGEQTFQWGTDWINNHVRDGHALGKPVVLEEFGWAVPGGTEEQLETVRAPIYAEWTGAVETSGGNGSQYWLLTARQDDGTLYPNYDGYRVLFPSPTADVLAASARRLAAST
jgi:mannan endo-1,4-beta-mannosidase